MFYYDPGDPRVFLPKATGLGWTLNFAHPISWVFIAVVALIVVVSVSRRRGKRG